MIFKSNSAASLVIAIIFGISLCYIFSLEKNQIAFSMGFFIAASLIITLIIKPEIPILFLAILGSLLGSAVAESTMFVQGQWTINLIGVLNILIIVGGIFYLLSRKVNIFEFAFSHYYLLFLLICAFSIFITPDKLTGLRDCVRMGSYFIIYLLCLCFLDSKKKIIRLVKFILLSAIIPSVFGFVQFILKKGSSGGFENRIFATFVHPNSYAFYLVMLLPIAIVLSRYYSKATILKALLLAYCGILGFLLVVTYTRSAWIGILIAMFIISLRYKKVFIFSLLIIVLLILLVPTISGRLEELSTPLRYTTNSFNWRLDLWKKSIDLFLHRPFIGHGIGSYPIYAEDLVKEAAYAHNDYIKIAIETGILGLVAYFLLLFNLLKYAIITYRTVLDQYFKTLALGLISIVMTFVVISFADNLLGYLQVEWYFWLFVGSIEAGRRIDILAKDSGARVDITK